jgi:hypothetical protein
VSLGGIATSSAAGRSGSGEAWGACGLPLNGSARWNPPTEAGMRLARRAVLASILVAVVIGLVTPSALAGGSWVSVEPRSWARQGSEIRLHGTFGEGYGALVSAGPWFAYLNPLVGPAPATLVGRVTIAPNTGNYGFQWRLTATLRVPHVAPGAYSLMVCDRGCKKGVGDLIGVQGRFIVVGSPRQQALRIQRLQTGLRHARHRQEQQLTDLNGAIASADARADALEREIGQLRDQLAAEQRERRAWFAAALISVLVVAALILMIWRRHRSRVHVPDTPAELLDRADADR